MTLNDIITEVDDQKPNQYDDADKIRWISKCEGKIVDSVFLTHTNPPVTEFDGYTSADMDTELLIPDTYADVYKYYLFAMIDATNGELKRYEGSMQLFNSMLMDFTDFYNRTHTPLKRPLKIFKGGK